MHSFYSCILLILEHQPYNVIIIEQIKNQKARCRNSSFNIEFTKVQCINNHPNVILPF